MSLNRELIIVGDTTFFSHGNGLIVFREPHLKQNVYWNFVPTERIEYYRQGRLKLEQGGYSIKAVVLDGRPGIRAVFSDLPVQMCHFHQKQIIKRYLTSRPKLEASRELKALTNELSKISGEEFIAGLNQWEWRWQEFMNEKAVDASTGRRRFIHRRLRSAYRSLKNNLPYLFTYQKYPELHLPNTTNCLDGFFNRLKSLIYVHRGQSVARRKRIIIEILKGRNRQKRPHQKDH